MSLTSFIKIPEVREKFLKTFPFESPLLQGTLKAPPQTENYSLVGTAFDYLLRFYVEQWNPMAVTRRWIAEDGVELIKDHSEIYEGVMALINKFKKIHEQFLKNGVLTAEVAASCIVLAKLDFIYRAGQFDPNLLDINKGDITDLGNLMTTVNPRVFKSTKVCVLNPTFGAGSELVSGADADLFIDDTLIDIKTTKNLKFTREHFNQLVGYLILSRIGGIDGISEHRIKNIGIYFSRHGLLHIISASDIENNPEFDSFVNWFKEKAKETF